MSDVLGVVQRDVLNPKTLTGAVAWGIVFMGIATVLATMIRRTAKTIAARLSDVTGLRFASALAQLGAYLLAAILYAHIVPELRALGTALLTGVSVVSIVVGLAAQTALGNMIAGLALVLYRPLHVGDRVQLATPKGLVVATMEFVSLGYTALRDDDGDEIIVPNSVMVSSVVIRLAESKTSPIAT
jgi:small-conductance mechanosensitive channel